MLNQETQNSRPASRRDYNKQYYLKRKEELQKKRKERSNVLQLFSRMNSKDGGGHSRFIRSLQFMETVLLLILVFMMTTYLVSEAARFYLDALENPWMAYLKAGAIEGVAILFSFSRGKGIVIRWAQRVVVVLLCTLTMWTLSDRLIGGTGLKGGNFYRFTGDMDNKGGTGV